MLMRKTAVNHLKEFKFDSDWYGVEWKWKWKWNGIDGVDCGV